MYSKTSQLKNNKSSKKVCSVCHVKRDIKFFSSPRAVKCGDCKRKSWKLKKNTSRKTEVKKLDKEWSIKVKERDGFKCVYCGKKQYLNAHHIYSRKNYTTRWDIENGISLCPSHHTLSSTFSAHKTPMLFYDFLLELKGQEFIDRLRKKANSVTKPVNDPIGKW